MRWHVPDQLSSSMPYSFPILADNPRSHQADLRNIGPYREKRGQESEPTRANDGERSVWMGAVYYSILHDQ
jgi:hypothetical protein